MKRFLVSTGRQVKSVASRFNKVSLARWGIIIATVTGAITLAQWLFPDPFNNLFHPTPPPPSLAESLGITQPIPDYRPGTIRILIATFDGPDEESRKVSADIKTTLERNLAYEFNSAIEVVGTNRVITEMEGSDVAVQIGELYNASIVIWGWYGLADKLIPLGVHFEILNSSGTLGAAICPASTSQKRTVSREDLEDLTLQTNLSNEYTYVTLFTLGLARFGAGDWYVAIENFDEAVKYIPDGELSGETSKNKLLLNQDLLYYYRGIALRSIGHFDKALSDFKEIESNWIGDPYYHIELGLTYLGVYNNSEAVNQFSLAYENSESSSLKATTLLYRGILNYRVGNYQEVNNDMNLAISIDESSLILPLLTGQFPREFNFNAKDLESQNLNNALTYFLRAINNDNQEESLSDYNKSIEIAPDFLLAHFKRADLLREKLLTGGKDFTVARIALNDLNIVAESEDLQVPCTYLNLGIVNRILDQDQPARNAFSKAISLATDEIKRNPTNIYAYNERGAAYYQMGNNFLALFDLIRLKLMNADEISSLDLKEPFRYVIKDLVKQLIPTIPFFLVSLLAIQNLRLNRQPRTRKSHK